MKIIKLVCFVLALVLSVLAMTACSKRAAATEVIASQPAKTEPAKTEPTETEPASETTDEASVDDAEASAESAEEGSIEERLAAAKLRVAELEALVEKYRPFYEAQIVATYGDGNIIWKDAALEQYNAAVDMYKQYGISADSFAGEIKKGILEGMVREAVLDAKALELGLKELSEETLAELKTRAETVFNSYVEQYKIQFAKDADGKDRSDEEAAAATTEYLNQNGLTVDSLLARFTNDHISEQLHASVTGDVTVSEEEVKAKYDSMVKADQERYADDRAYNNARANGTLIAWNPEGYRAVKHVLVKFSDDQTTRYRDLRNRIDSLNAELEALDNPKTTEAPAEADKTDEGENASEAAPAEDATAQKTEDSEASEAEEKAVETRTREQIQAELDQANADMDALYAELEPKAREAVEAFNGGAEFDSLIEKYGEDPGMATEPAKTQGYAVSTSSTAWEKAFTDGAMAISEVGKISEPVRGTKGLHVIYYMGDITPGAVPFEDISEEVSKQALADKVADTYDKQVAAWVEEAAPVYYTDRF